MKQFAVFTCFIAQVRIKKVALTRREHVLLRTCTFKNDLYFFLEGGLIAHVRNEAHLTLPSALLGTLWPAQGLMRESV